MSEIRKNAVTMKGSPLNLIGAGLSVGSTAPAFTLSGVDLSDKTLADYQGKVKIVSVVPSIDTSVCDIQTRRFNEEAVSLGEDVVILTVSVDLPFAFKRWCGAAGVERLECLSDYKTRQFGEDYGLLVEGLAILTRAVLVIDKNDQLVYQQIVPEIASEPDYTAALSAAQG